MCLRLSTLAYHSLTNLCGLQTLGEEYCGILQVDELGSQIPGKIVRIYCLFGLVIYLHVDVC